MNGMVYLVGAGPGDYRLITLKGKECLEKADVVICDYLADKRLMAFAKDDVEYIYVGKKLAITQCVKKISANLSLIKRKKENAWYA